MSDFKAGYRISQEKVDYIFSLLKKDNALKINPQLLCIYRAMCTVRRVPELLLSKGNTDLVIDELISNVNFSSDIMTDEFSWIPFGYWIINRYILRQTVAHLSVIYRLVYKVISSVIDPPDEIEQFILTFWYKFAENYVKVPNVLIKSIVRKMPFILEKHIIEQLQNAQHETYYDELEFKQFSKVCNNSPYMFQLITSILNEILLSASFDHTLQFIRKVIDSIKRFYVKFEDDNDDDDISIIRLYPISLQPLISICYALDIRGDARKRNQTDEEILNNMLRKQFNAIRHPKQIVVLLSHFPEWATYASELPLKSEYRKVLQLD